MFAALKPKQPFRLVNAFVPVGMVDASLRPSIGEDTVRLNIDIDSDGRIVAVAPHQSRLVERERFGQEINLEGRQLWTRTADLHTHLDKTQTWERASNADGSLNGAKQAAKKDRNKIWAAEDVRKRMSFGLRCALANGTRSIRTHIDCQKGRTEPSWDIFVEFREAWSDLITMQGVATLGAAKLEGSYGEELAEFTARANGILGPVVYNTPTAAVEIARAFDLAERFDLALDFHVDETLDAAADGLSLVAAETKRRGYEGRVVCGHCCSLALKDDETIKRITDNVAQAGIGVVVLPMTNTYLLGRNKQRSPIHRGLAPVQYLRDAGIPVAFASDNCRDAFHPYGDHDVVEVFREVARLGHADLPWGPWASSVASVPEHLMGVDQPAEISIGAPADLIVFEGRTFSEVFARLGAPRTVLVQGKPLDRTKQSLPSFAELDGDREDNA